MIDETFYVALAFVTVIGAFLFLRLPGKITKSLDERAEQIQAELDRAHALRMDAENLLAEYEAKRNAAEKQAEQIVEDAKANAERLALEAKEKLDQQLERRTQGAELKIARAEANMIKEVQAAVTQAAIATAEQLIKDALNDGQRSALVDQNISELSKRF
jgi:F-type H+-transporting ATPase subunit b